MKQRSILSAATLLLLGLFPAGASAQEQRSPEELFYEAFYQESGLRDFGRARELYAATLERGGTSLATALVARARAGLARSLEALGQSAAAADAWRGVLELEPANSEAKAGVVRAGQATPDEQIDAAIRAQYERLRGPKTHSDAVPNLLLFRGRAVPLLRQGLQEPYDFVQQSCLEMLLQLGREGEASATQALVEELQRAPRLGQPLTQMLAGPYSSSLLEVYRALHRHEDPSVRRQMVSNLWMQLLNSPPQTIYSQEEQALRPLLELVVHDSDATVRDALFSVLRHSQRYEGIPASSRPLIDGFVERAWTSKVPSEPLRARELALSVKQLFRAHAAELLPQVLAGTVFDESRTFPWIQTALQGDWLTSAEVYGLLDDGRAPVRMEAWRWLVAKLGTPEGIPATRLQARVEPMALEWLEWTRVGSTSNIGSEFAGLELSPALLARLWKELEPGKYREGDRRRDACRSVLSRFTESLESRAAAGGALRETFAALGEGEWRARFLSELRSLGDDVIPIGAMIEAASDSNEDVRWIANDLLRAAVYRGLVRTEELELPLLARDVAAQDRAAIFLAVQRPTDAIRAQMDRLLPELSDPVELASLLAARALCDAPEKLGGYAARLLFPQSDDSEPVWRAFVEAFRWVTSSEHEPWFVELVKLARTRPALLDVLLRTGEVAVWPYPDVLQLCEAALSDPKGPDGLVYQALTLVSRRNLALPAASLYPHLRSDNEAVRGAAEAALQCIERLRGYERLAASFTPADAARTVEAIRANAASTSLELRRAAAHAIAALGDPGGIALLLDLAQDQDPGVRQAALQSLESMATHPQQR